jgi:hypothetical protein
MESWFEIGLICSDTKFGQKITEWTEMSAIFGQMSFWPNGFRPNEFRPNEVGSIGHVSKQRAKCSRGFPNSVSRAARKKLWSQPHVLLEGIGELLDHFWIFFF